MSEVDQPVSFQAPKGVGDEAVLERLTMVLDIQAALAGVRRLRSWARDALAPHPGQRAVDVGSGTGEEVQALATGVGPAGEAIGVEPNAGLRAEAERRAAAAGSGARFIDGSAYALPFDESTVDLMRCERVWQHLDEPDKAAAEVARVLRPGGRTVVIDTDWATSIMHPGDPAVIRSINDFWLSQFPNPFSGRKLSGQLNAAGLRVTDVGSQALIQDPGMIDTLMRTAGGFAVEAGVVTQAQFDELIADLHAGVARGDFHTSVTMFAALARKT